MGVGSGAAWILTGGGCLHSQLVILTGLQGFLGAARVALHQQRGRTVTFEMSVDELEAMVRAADLYTAKISCFLLPPGEEAAPPEQTTLRLVA